MKKKKPEAPAEKDNVKKLVPNKPLPTLEFEAEFKVKVTMGPLGFKIEHADDLYQNLASLLIARKIMKRTADVFVDQKKTTKDGKLRKALQDRIPRMNQAMHELDAQCKEIYHMTAMSVKKEELMNKNKNSGKK